MKEWWFVGRKAAHDTAWGIWGRRLCGGGRTDHGDGEAVEERKRSRRHRKDTTTSAPPHSRHATKSREQPGPRNGPGERSGRLSHICLLLCVDDGKSVAVTCETISLH